MVRLTTWTLAAPLLLAVVLLGGCAVGPDYVAPEIDWQQEWEADLYDELGSGEHQAALALEVWWHLFDDPVLNRLIEMARAENPSFRVAGLKVLEARAAVGIARGYRYPQVQQLTWDGTYSGSLPEGGDWSDGFSSGFGFDVGWEIDFWGKYRRGIEAADAAFFASTANQQDFQVLLAAQVADLYFAYRTTVLRADIARKNAEIQGRSFDITRELYENGAQAELDLQQAKTQYMSTLSSIPAFEQTLHQLRNALCVLVGRPPGDLPELDAEIRELPEIDPVLVEDIPAQLLIRRPDIRAAAMAVAAQTAQVGISEAAKYPSISLFGTVGLADSDLSLGVGPSVTWPIFNYGRIKNDVRVQDARLQQALENFQAVALQAAREIDDAAITVIKTREQKDPQHQSSQAAERSLELATTRYREGYAGFQRVIEAQRAAAGQNDREILLAGDHLSAIITFYKAVGGGWREMTFEELIPEETRQTMEDRTNWGDLLRDPQDQESPTTASDNDSETGEQQ